MFEKEDLVQALIKAREAASIFSANIIPGQVGELTDVQVDEELTTDSSTPLILDVYATWCGPCKLMAPELVQAAAELGDKVRVAKIELGSIS
jgi:thiol-disulfide isomerase/thioredoxin